MKFKFIMPRKVTFGKGTLARIGEEAGKLSAKNALIVTSKGMLRREVLSQVIALLQKQKLNYRIFPRVNPEPPIEDLHDCIAFAQEGECDLFIGLGGGSVMDVTKKAAAELFLPKILVPTTAGTGSEVTHESVFKVDGMKRAFVDERLTADIALVDPDLSRTMPPKLTAACGMDALAHAIECYDSKRGNPLVKALASEAYTIIISNLRKAINDDEQGRVNMALGSLMAGIAFANSGTALAHALSYPLSNQGIPHGEAVAMVLPHVLEFNNFDKNITTEVQELLRELGLSRELKGSIPDMAEIVMTDTRHLSNSPRKVSVEDIITIYEKVRNEGYYSGSG